MSVVHGGRSSPYPSVDVATMAMPQPSATTSDDVLLGNTITSSAIAASDADAPTKKEEADEKDTEASNAVKANKGMILRKSVEYIRWVSKLSVRRRVWGDCESRDERGVVICAEKRTEVDVARRRGVLVIIATCPAAFCGV